MEGNRLSVCPGQACVSVPQGGFWVAGLSGGGAEDSAMSAWMQGASLVPTSYTQHPVLPSSSVLPHPVLSCPTQSSLASLKLPKAPGEGGWAVFAILSEETDVQSLC